MSEGGEGLSPEIQNTEITAQPTDPTDRDLEKNHTLLRTEVVDKAPFFSPVEQIQFPEGENVEFENTTAVLADLLQRLEEDPDKEKLTLADAGDFVKAEKTDLANV